MEGAEHRAPMLAAGHEMVWRTSDALEGRSAPTVRDRVRAALSLTPALPGALLASVGLYAGAWLVLAAGGAMMWGGAAALQSRLRTFDEMGGWRIDLAQGSLDLEGHVRSLRGSRVSVERDGLLGPLSPAWLVVRWPDGRAARLARARPRELLRLCALVEEATREADRPRTSEDRVEP